MSTAYHPQSDGQTEVVNRCLECYLGCMCREKPKEWVTWLPMAEYWYNTNYHTTIGTSPYEMVYGQKPLLYLPYIAGTNPNEEVDRSLEHKEQVVKDITAQLQRAQVRMTNLANKHKTDREFAVGDFVYLKLQPHRQVTVRQGSHHKLSTKYYGPFAIIDRVGKVAYRLKLPDTAAIHPVFHVSQLKLCHGDPATNPFVPFPIPATTRVPIAVLD